MWQRYRSSDVGPGIGGKKLACCARTEDMAVSCTIVSDVIDVVDTRSLQVKERR